MRTAVRIWVLVAWAVASLGCQTRATQFVVVIDSDMLVPEELARVEVSVAGRGADPLLMTFGEDAPLTLPLSFGVAPQDRADAVSIEARGLTSDGRLLVTRRVTSAFVSGRSILLPIPLARACADTSPCLREDLTCHEGECVSASLDASLLPDVEPTGPPARLLAPTAPQDGGSAEADAGPACVVGARCETETDCAMGEMRCSPPRCEQVGMMPVGSICGTEGRTCDAEGRCGSPR